MASLNVTIVQTDIFWKDPYKNTEHLTNVLKETSSTDLIVLPETFNTGFYMKPEEIAEPVSGFTITWMKEMAQQLGSAICGSLAVKENNHFYNRFVFVTPEGKTTYYNKRHCFSYGGEGKAFHSGNEQVIITYKNWKIAPFICYDLRFPVWSRNTQDYDLAIYIANWPDKRALAWDTLLNARAIENMCYVVGVNRIGQDGNGYMYNGSSKIVNPMGEELIKLDHRASIVDMTLDQKELINTRNQFKFLNDKDDFKIHL